MVVDDAVVVRGLLTRWIEAEDGLQIVGSMRSGREAIEQLKHPNPDVVILDVDMPDTDGITALPRLLEKKRDLVVIMASTLTRRNAEISLRALALGASDYIPKPESTREITTSALVPPRADRKDQGAGGIAPQTRRRRRSGAGRSGDGADVDRPEEAALRRVPSPPIAPASQEQGGAELRPLPMSRRASF